jgi:hypothetical protein
MNRETLVRHVAADVDRVAPLLARLLLVQAVVRIRDRYNSGHSLWVARDMVSDCREELLEAGATTRELARALVPDHDVDQDLTAAIAGTEQLSAAVRRESNSFWNYHHATDPDGYIDKQRTDEAWEEWHEDKGRAESAYHALPSDLDGGETGSLLLDRALDHVFYRGLYYEIRHYHFSREPQRAWRRRVARVLTKAACARLDRGDAAGTGDLADSVREGRRVLDATAPSAAAHGQEAYTATKGTAIRLMALCLARELEAARIRAADDPFRDVVIGITLMEQDSPEARHP